MMRGWAIAMLVVLSGLLPWRQSWAAEAAPERSYSGDVFTRSTFTGDLNGDRTYLATKGITFDANLTQVEQGVVSGGKNGAWEYGGRGDLTAHLDTGKLGLWPGGFLTAELEGNWRVGQRQDRLDLAGEHQPLFPVPAGENVGVPDLSFAQFFSPMPA